MHFQFDSRTGPPPGAGNNQSVAARPVARRATSECNSETNGTVRECRCCPVRSRRGISLDELAGGESRQIDLSGTWWAAWQTWKDGQEIINPHVIGMRQRGDVLDVTAETRGTQELDEGGYLWRGELRIWDNEVLMGWYVATEGAVRSKGTMYFALHQHGQRMTGRWVGLSYDGPIVTGWGTIARTEEEVLALMDELREKGKVPS